MGWVPPRTTLPGEEWRSIDGVPGYYVSNLGRVWSGLKGPGRVRRNALDQNGYPITTLWHAGDGRQESRRIHILMMEAFVGPRPTGAVIRHLDGDPSNCNLANLRYGTHAENGLDAVDHGTHTQSSKTHCAHGHEFTPENTYHRPDRPNSRECRTCRRFAGTRWGRDQVLGGESNRVG